MTLVRIDKPRFDVELYLAYAMEDNVTGMKLYKNPYCYLNQDATTALERSIRLAGAIGLKLKIFDAFRPLESQQALWDKFPDPEFVSHPQTGRTPHCRGAAVDLTLIDSAGKELEMGTGFDAFTPLSHHSVIDIPVECQKNRHILMGIMTASGWQFNPNEWWHYQLYNVEQYPKFTDKQAGTGML
jgi:D-alanyl-D-alanine dipeptidase